MSEIDKRRERLEQEGTNEIMKQAQLKELKGGLMLATKAGVLPDNANEKLEKIDDKEFLAELSEALEGGIETAKRRLVDLLKFKNKVDSKK
jgi:hypothetical protein